MKLLITGATGFVGRYVVAEAIARGHGVRAVARSGSVPGAETVGVDLRSRKGLTEAVAGVDAVIHLAAAKAGDLYAQLGSTVVATENLLAAMTEAGVGHIVGISSLAVYDFQAMPEGSTLDESSPTETDGFDRDEYAQTKLIQERLIRRHAEEHRWRCTTLRPGVIWGRESPWSARLGMQLGSGWWVRTGSGAKLPLTYVENCAQAIIRAAESTGADGQVVNVIDDQTPTQKQFVAMLRDRAPSRPKVIPVPWTVMKLASWSADIVNRRLLGGQAKIPGLFVRSRLHARLKPLTYNNSAAKTKLAWQPRYSLAQSLDRTFGERHPLEVGG